MFQEFSLDPGSPGREFEKALFDGLIFTPYTELLIVREDLEGAKVLEKRVDNKFVLLINTISRR